ILPLRPAIFDRHVLSVDETGVAHALTERSQQVFAPAGPPAIEPSDFRHFLLLRTRRQRPRGRRAANQRDELAAFHVDFALPLIASPASACHPASLSFTRATSIILPSAIVRSACADASPARTSSTSSSPVNPFANISASVQPSGDAASSSRARRRSGLRRRLRRG